MWNFRCRFKKIDEIRAQIATHSDGEKFRKSVQWDWPEDKKTSLKRLANRSLDIKSYVDRYPDELAKIGALQKGQIDY